jgi:hypothetical protein
MSSLIDRGLEFAGSGRKRIGISGIYNEKETIIDVDVTTSYTLTENATITNHPIEAENDGNLQQISDYVVPSLPTIQLDIVISGNLGLKSAVSLGLAESDSVSMKDKVKILTYWQKTGAVLNILGYTTGSNGAGKFLNALSSGVQNFFSTTEPDAFYTGLDTDVVTDVVLGNIQWKRTTEIGIDVSANITLQKIQRAIPKTGSVQTSGSGSGSNIPKKGNTNPQKVEPKKEIKKSTIKGG